MRFRSSPAISADPCRGKKRLEAADDPGLSLLYYLFAAKGWGLRDLRAFYEGRDGWMDIIRAFAAHQVERRGEGFKW